MQGTMMEAGSVSNNYSDDSEWCRDGGRWERGLERKDTYLGTKMNNIAAVNQMIWISACRTKYPDPAQNERPTCIPMYGAF